MRILISATNYNSEERLHNYLHSIEAAFGQTKNVRLVVLIGDNSSQPIELDPSQYSFTLEYNFNNANLGYIGGIERAISETCLDVKEFDFVIISNVDVEVTPDFLSSLSSKDYKESIGWIAPSIQSLKEKKDRNPKILNRYAKWKMYFFKALYTIPFLSSIYYVLIYKKKDGIVLDSMSQIYGGHGSFMIFTREFIHRIQRISFPSFLFGEEIFFAEEVRLSGLQVTYDKSLKIIDYDHESTGQLTSRKKSKMFADSINMLISRYY